MIGDREWYELLWERYRQYLADCGRMDRPAQAFTRWAVEVTWRDFERLARLVLALPPFALNDWETHSPIGAGHGGGYRSTVLARRLIGALLLVRQALLGLQQWRRAYAAVKCHLERGKVAPGQERALGLGKRWLYEWLVRAAQRNAQ